MGADSTVTKRTNNDLQNITQKTEDRATQTELKTGGELMCSWRVAGPAPYVTPVVLLLNDTNIILTNITDVAGHKTKRLLL